MRRPSEIVRRISRSPSAVTKLSNFFSLFGRTLNVNTSPLSTKIANGVIRDEGHGILKEFWPKVSRRARASRKARQNLARVTEKLLRGKEDPYLDINLTKVDPIPRSSMESTLGSEPGNKEIPEAETEANAPVEAEAEAEAETETMVETMPEEQLEAEAKAEATIGVDTDANTDAISASDAEAVLNFEVDYKPCLEKVSGAKEKFMKFNQGVKGIFSKIGPTVQKVLNKARGGAPVRPPVPPLFPQRVPSGSREPFLRPEYSQLDAIQVGFEQLIMQMPVYAKPRIGFRAKTCLGFTRDLKEMYLAMFDYTCDLDYMAKASSQKCRKIADATYDAYLFRDKVFEFYDDIKYQLQLMDYAQALCLFYKKNGCTKEEALRIAQDFSEWKSAFLDYEILMRQYPALFKEANRDIKEANEYSARLTNHVSLAKKMEETFSKMKRKFGYRKSLKRRYLDRLAEYFDDLHEAFVGSMAYEIVGEFVEYVERANLDLFESLKKLNLILNIIHLIHESNLITDRFVYDLLVERDLC